MQVNEDKTKNKDSHKNKKRNKRDFYIILVLSILFGIIPVGTGITNPLGINYDKSIDEIENELNRMEEYIDNHDDSKNEERLDQRKEELSEIPPITALCYHEVSPYWVAGNDPLNVSPEDFRQHIHEFKENGYEFIDIGDIRDYKQGKRKLDGEKYVLIAFDDGYLDNYLYAYQILKEEGVTGSFFLVGNSIGTKNRMTLEQIHEMQENGMKFGSHTMNHEKLDDLTIDKIEYELKESRRYLEEKLGTEVYALAYPGGYINQKIIDIAKRYYGFAFIASIEPYQKENFYTINRYGVFRWHHHISSIFNTFHEKSPTSASIN